MPNTILPSPLAEANAVSLDELFSRDPEQLNQKDLETIVTELRRQRKAFKEAEDRGELPKTGRKAKGPKEELSLKDLGLA